MATRNDKIKFVNSLLDLHRTTLAALGYHVFFIDILCLPTKTTAALCLTSLGMPIFLVGTSNKLSDAQFIAAEDYKPFLAVLYFYKKYGKDFEIQLTKLYTKHDLSQFFTFWKRQCQVG